MHTPLVSVILPVYNGGDYLREAIESILSQTYSNFEFIIINDGSTDDSLSIIESFNDSRIRRFSQRNCGLSRTLNKCMEIAKGDYIARMDADDISDKNRLLSQVTFLQTNPKIGLVGCAYRIIGTEGALLGTRYPLTVDYYIRRHLYIGNPFCHGSVLFRRDLVEQVGGYNVDAKAEDYDLWCRFMAITQFANLPEVLYNYRVNVTSSLMAINNSALQRESQLLNYQLWERSLPQLLMDRLTDKKSRIYLEIKRMLQDPSCLNGKHSRSSRKLFNLVALAIIRKLFQKNKKNEAFKEWCVVCKLNYSYPVELMRCVKALFSIAKSFSISK